MPTERELAILLTAKNMTAQAFKQVQAGFKTMGQAAKAHSSAVQSSMSRAMASIRRLGASVKTQFGRMTNWVNRHKRAFLVAFAAIGAAIATAIKTYADFEEQVAFVGTMLDEQTMKLLPGYAQQLRLMAIEYGESTKTLSRGLYDILSASVNAEKAIGVLTAAVKAAKAGMTDTAVAADAITSVMNAYGYAAEDAGKISDILFAIVKRGKTTFAELAPNIGKVVSTANLAGLSFEELGASIATLTRSGVRTEEAMTAINGVLRAIIKPQKDAIAMFAELSKKNTGVALALDTTTLRSKGLVGMLKALKGATAEQLAVISPNIRGLKGFAAGLAKVEEQGKDLELMLNSLGLTQEAYGKVTDTVRHSMNRFKELMIVTSGVIGEELAPAFKDMIDFLVKNKDAVVRWGKTIGESILNVIEFFVRLGLRVSIIMKTMSQNIDRAVIAALNIKKVILAIKLGDHTKEIEKVQTAINKWEKRYEELGDEIKKAKGMLEDLSRGTVTYLDVSKKNSQEIKKVTKNTEEMAKNTGEATKKQGEFNGVFKNSGMTLKEYKEWIEKNISSQEEFNAVIEDGGMKIKEYMEWMKERMSLQEELTDRTMALTLSETDLFLASLEKKRAEYEKYGIAVTEIIKWQAAEIEGFIESGSKKTKESLDLMAHITKNTATMMQQSMSSYFFNVMKGEFRSLADVARGFGNMMLEMIAQIAAAWVVSRIIPGIGFTALLGMHKGGRIPVMHKGGELPSYQTGGIINAEPGEFIVNRRDTARNLPMLTAINKGQKVTEKAGANYYIVINAVDSRSFVEMLNRNPEGVINLVNQDIMMNGITRGTMRRYM